MGRDYSNTGIDVSFGDFFKVEALSQNSGIDSTTRIVSDATGTETPLKLSTVAVEVTGGQFLFNQSGSGYSAIFESSNNSHMLFVDSSNDKVGVNKSTGLLGELHVGGTLYTDGGSTINDTNTTGSFIVKGVTDDLLINTNASTERVGIGAAPNEKLTVEGVVSLNASSHPTFTSSYGKLYTYSIDGELYYLTPGNVRTQITRTVILPLPPEFEATDNVTAPFTGIKGITIPSSLNNNEIVGVEGAVNTKGITGFTGIQIRRRRSGADTDVLNAAGLLEIADAFSDNNVTIDNAVVQTGDIIYYDITDAHSTPAKGLNITLLLRTPQP